MSNNTVRIIRFTIGIVLSVLLVITGLLFILACVAIYQSGNRPFTPENIGKHFASIQIPVYITLAALVIGILVRLFLPRTEKKERIVPNRRAIMQRAERRIDTTDPQYAEVSQREIRFRKILRIAAPLLCAIAALPALIYVFNFNHFTMDYNASVIESMPYLLSSSTLSVAISTAYLILSDRSYKRQAEAARQLFPKYKDARATLAPIPEKKEHPLLVRSIRLSIIVGAIVLLVLGILNGGMADVLDKAINICTECIGLG